MWITEQVDLPQPLIAAQQRGDLVVFVGAGASMDPPSALPSFAGLAKRIAVDAGVPPPDESQQLDEFLGDLDGPIDVHRRVHDIISAPGSTPNALHDALVRLPRDEASVRIVTTNYDQHLSTAMTRTGVSATEYDGPALPLGDDFSGVVYLHGSVRQPPPRLVVTDGDFGRAYLTEAWAARFLYAMFRRYVVLFVGYSHNDVVMTYLARALPADAVRFALTPAPDEARWRRYGITPVSYPTPADGDHSELRRALAQWADDAHTGLLDQRERVRGLVQLPPPEEPRDRSYLETVVADPDQVGFFTEFATGEAWLAWASEQASFKDLFQVTSRHHDVSRALARWFASIVVDDSLSGVALRTLQRLGGRLSPELWWEIAGSFHAADPKPSCKREWAVVLTSTAPEHTSDLLDYMLAVCEWPADRDLALMLLDYLIQVDIVLGPTWTPVEVDTADRRPGRYVHADARLRGDDHWLQEAWENLFKPNLVDCAAEVAVMAERHLRDAHRKLRLLGAGTDRWDPISFQRSAIEPHEQDHIGREVNVLIDAARDALEHLLQAQPEAGAAITERSERSDVPILRRLAIHGWTVRTDRSADDKLQHAVASGWLYGPSLKHETFQLLKAAIPEASTTAIDGLVRAALNGPADMSERSSDYEVFNLLNWISTFASDSRSVTDALHSVTTEHPDFAPRDHPDVDSYMETGWVAEQLPMTVEMYHDIVSRDPREAIDAVLRYRETRSAFEGPRWEDAQALVGRTLAGHPEDGYRLLEALRNGPDAAQAMGGSIVRGLGASATTGEDWSQLLRTLAALPHLSAVADDIAQLLEDASRNRESGLGPENITAARTLADAVWPHLSGSSVSGMDWLGRAINSGYGRVAEFWLHSISIEARAAGDTWAGIDDPTKAALDRMVRPTTESEAFALVVLASQLHFVFAVEEEWAVRKLIPVFDWAGNEHRAEQAWDGFLSWGRWNDRLLSAGLKEAFTQSFPKLAGPLSSRRARFCRYIAAVAVTSSIPDIGPDFARGLVAVADDAARVAFAAAMEDVLRETPPDVAVTRWDDWIKDYLSARVSGVPRPISRDEGAEIAGWLLSIGDRFPEGVSLLIQAPAAFGKHHDVLYRLKESDLVTAYPEQVANLITHLARGTVPPFWGGSFLRGIVDRLRPAVGRALLEPLVEQALRLGCASAPTWLDD